MVKKALLVLLAIMALGVSDLSAAAKIRVGLVCDIGGIADGAWNQLSWEGIQRFAKAYGLVNGADYMYLETSSSADYYAKIEYFAKQRFDVVITSRFLFEKAVTDAAIAYPKQNFAIIDMVIPDRPNVVSAVFQEHEGSYLAGIAAGSRAKADGLNVVGFIGGMKFALIEKYEAGFAQGVKAVHPDCVILVDYAGDFASPDKGRAFARKLYDLGAYVIYHAAGATGYGIIQEAKERSARGDLRWAVGSDENQHAAGKFADGTSAVLTSMLKRFDVVSYDIAELALKGAFPGGKILVYGVAQGGVTLATDNRALDAPIVAAIRRAEDEIRSGALKVDEIPDPSTYGRLPEAASGNAARKPGDTPAPGTATSGDEIWGTGEIGADIAIVIGPELAVEDARQSALRGARAFAEEYGLAAGEDFAVFRPDEDGIAPLLEALAEAGTGLVLCTGARAAIWLSDHAPRYPDTLFGLLDGVAEYPVDDGGPIDNVLSGVFSEEEGAFLAGVAAGLKARNLDEDVLGYLGSTDGSWVAMHLAGFEAGVRAVHPFARVLVAYVDDYDSEYDAARELFDRGAFVVYLDDECEGDGAIAAAIEYAEDGERRWVIAPNGDRRADGRWAPGESVVLASVIRRYDLAVEIFLTMYADGNFPAGEVFYLDIAHGMIGLSDRNMNLSYDIDRAIDAWIAIIGNGFFVVPTTPVPR